MLRLIAISFFSRFGTAIINFLTIILLSRFLGPEGKGEATRMLVIFSSVQIICDFAGGAALVFYSSRFRLKSLLVPVWCWSAVCSLALVIWLWFSEHHLLRSLAIPAGLLCFVNATYAQHIHLLNGRQWFKTTGAMMFLQALLTFSFLFFLLETKAEVLDYFFALCMGWGLPWLISLGLLFRLSAQTDSPEGKPLPLFSITTDLPKLLGSGSANQLGHLLQFFNQRIFFLFMPAFALGIYSNAVALGESIWMIASSIAMIQYGKIANMSDRHQAAQLTANLLKGTIWFTFFAVIAAALVPETMYLLLFGKEFMHVKDSLLVLLPGVLSLSGYLIVGHYFSGTGRFNKNNLSIAAGVIVTLLGFAGYRILYNNLPNEITAAWITSVANAATFFSVIWLFKTDCGIHWKTLIPRWSDLRQLQKWFRSAT